LGFIDNMSFFWFRTERRCWKCWRIHWWRDSTIHQSVGEIFLIKPLMIWRQRSSWQWISSPNSCSGSYLPASNLCQPL
jgi:hypothetical protein